MGIGVSDTVGSANEIIDQAALTAELGYDAFWTQELIDTKDGITTAAAIAAKGFDLDIVVGLPSPYLRHPAVIATELCSIDDYSGGRTAGLVVGTNAPEILRKLDEPVDRPIRTMSETCDILRALIDEGFCDYSGEVFELTNWKLRSEFQSDSIPIYLAGMGPKMRELAAYKFDGLFLPFNTPVEFVRTVSEDLSTHLTDFDRSKADFTLSLNIPTVALDPEAAAGYEEQIRDVVTFTGWHCCSDHIRPLVEQAGITYDDGDLRAAVRSADYDQIRSIITDEFLNAVAVVGSPEACRERYQEYIDAGLDYPIIYNYGDADVKLRNVEALAPQP